MAEVEVGPSDRTLRASHSGSFFRRKGNVNTIFSPRSRRQSKQAVGITLTVDAHDLKCSFWHSLIVLDHKILIRSIVINAWIYSSTIYSSLKVITVLFMSCYGACSNYFSSLLKSLLILSRIKRVCFVKSYLASIHKSIKILFFYKLGNFL